MKNSLLIEENQIKSIFPVGTDLNAAAITGARVALKEFDKVSVVIEMGTSTAATVQVTTRQHNAASSGTSKDLVTDCPYHHKAGSADVFTKVERSSAAALIDVSTIFAANGGLLVLEIKGEQLDNDNGFNWFSVDIADSGAAKVAAGQYHLGQPRKLPAYNVATI